MASIFTKSFQDITFQDIEDLVEASTQEGETLDYKREFGNAKGIAKSISAFANTLGGYLVFGIAEKKDTNEPGIITGLTEDEKTLESKLHNACYDNVFPPVFVNHKILTSDDKKIKVLLVYIPESELTPHAVDNNTTVYIRYKDQRRSIPKVELRKATISELAWLQERRKKSIRLKEIQVGLSKDRYKGHFRKTQRPAFRMRVMVNPVFPKGPILTETEILRFARSEYAGADFMHYDGGVFINSEQDLRDIYMDFNILGFTCVGFNFWKVGSNDNELRIDWFLDYTKTAVKCGLKLFKAANYSGPAEVVGEVGDIKDTVISWDYQNRVPFLSLHGLKAEIENSIGLKNQFRIYESDKLILRFQLDFLTRLLFVYGYDKEDINSRANELIGIFNRSD